MDFWAKRRTTSRRILRIEQSTQRQSFSQSGPPRLPAFRGNLAPANVVGGNEKVCDNEQHTGKWTYPQLRQETTNSIHCEKILMYILSAGKQKNCFNNENKAN